MTDNTLKKISGDFLFFITPNPCLIPRVHPRCHPSKRCSGYTTWDVNPHVIAWHHNPWCHPSRYCSGATTQDVILWDVARELRLEMSTLVTLLGTTTQDVILRELLKRCDLRCQPFKTFLGTTPQDVTLHNIAREKWLEMSKRLWHYLEVMRQRFACKLFFLFEDSFGLIKN